MSINVYAVGRSGSGKSTAVRYMQRLIDAGLYSTIYIKDYTILLDMSKEPEHQAKFRLNKRVGFDILDPAAYDIALERLLGQIKHLEKCKEYDVIFIEFARRTYKEPFDKLSEVLQNKDYILFVEANLETCIERIDKRTNGCCGEDRHYISDEIMTSYFSVDNLPCMNDDFAKQLGLPPSHLKAICNEGSETMLKDETKDYANFISQTLNKQPKTALQVENIPEIPQAQPVEDTVIEDIKTSYSLDVVESEKEQVVLVGDRMQRLATA